jgi:hypothetical protein
MIIELLVSTIVAQGSVENVMKEVGRHGYEVGGPPATMSIIFNEDGTTTIEGPSDDEKRLDTLYNTLEKKHSEFFDNNTKIFESVAKNGLESKVDEGSYQKSILLEKEIKVLQKEYDALFLKIYPEMAPLFKKDKK